MFCKFPTNKKDPVDWDLPPLGPCENQVLAEFWMNNVKTGKETASSCGRTLYYHILGLYYIYIYIYGKYLAAPQTLATFDHHLVEKMAKHF